MTEGNIKKEGLERFLTAQDGKKRLKRTSNILS